MRWRCSGSGSSACTRRSRISTSQVAWSIEDDDFVEALANPIATLLGLSANFPPQTKEHLDVGEISDESTTAGEQAEKYEAMMTADCPHFKPGKSMLRKGVWQQTGPVDPSTSPYTAENDELTRDAVPVAGPPAFQALPAVSPPLPVSSPPPPVPAPLTPSPAPLAPSRRRPRRILRRPSRSRPPRTPRTRLRPRR